MQHRILVVDDEENVRRLIEYTLQKENFLVTSAADGKTALQLFENGCDFVILDVMLPDLDGFEILKRIRQKSRVPVLMLTARAEEIDRIVGLELGADDYLVKPFSPRELTARVKAILRRTNEDTTSLESNILIDDLEIKPGTRSVKYANKEILLTFKEYELLLLLAKNLNRVFTRAELLERVWGYDYYGDTRTIDVHIRHLREKIELDATNPRYVKTIRGVGYKFSRKE